MKTGRQSLEGKATRSRFALLWAKVRQGSVKYSVTVGAGQAQTQCYGERVTGGLLEARK